MQRMGRIGIVTNAIKETGGFDGVFLVGGCAQINYGRDYGHINDTRHKIKLQIGKASK